ncbi:MAG: hypothetical protein R2881_10890 [Eubacteriales bacterium]
MTLRTADPTRSISYRCTTRAKASAFSLMLVGAGSPVPRGRLKITTVFTLSLLRVHTFTRYV